MVPPGLLVDSRTCQVQVCLLILQSHQRTGFSPPETKPRPKLLELKDAWNWAYRISLFGSSGFNREHVVQACVWFPSPLRRH